MRTIQKILKYRFSDENLEILKKLGYINGCGAKEGFSFSKFIKENIKSFEEFLPNSNIFYDIEKCCNEHDLEYMFFRENFLGFFKANFNFAKKLFHLLHWTSFFQRLSLSFIVFFILQKYGKQAFEKSQSISLESILLIISKNDGK